MGKYSFVLLFILSGCSAIMPDVAQIIHDVEDTAIVVEVNRDAIKDNQNIDIAVKLTNKFPVTQ